MAKDTHTSAAAAAWPRQLKELKPRTATAPKRRGYASGRVGSLPLRTSPRRFSFHFLAVSDAGSSPGATAIVLPASRGRHGCHPAPRYDTARQAPRPRTYLPGRCRGLRRLKQSTLVVSIAQHLSAATLSDKLQGTRGRRWRPRNPLRGFMAAQCG